MRTTDSACACQSRHCSLLPVPRQALLHRAGFARRRQADAPISCTPPPLCRRSGPIASSGRHHPPNGTPEKSIEPCRFTVPPAFSPTKFLWRLRAPKTLTSFGAIPPQSRFLDAVALLLMTLVVGLLIAPAIYHRVMGDGDATAHIRSLIGLMMAAALIPFALAIGINVFIAIERIGGPGSAVLAGLAATGAALWFWFGIELFALRRKHG